MSELNLSSRSTPPAGTPLPVQAAPRIPVIALGLSLGLFLAVTSTLCFGVDLCTS